MKQQQLTIKKVLAQLHRWMGLASGLVVFIVALTGSLLVFENQLDPVLFRSELQVKATAAGRKPLGELVANAQKQFPGKNLFRIKVWDASDRSILLLFRAGKGEQQYAFIDPYSGHVLGKGQYTSRFFRKVREMHRFLLAGKTGKTVTGISCCIFIFLLLSGLVMWWPATKAALKQRFKIKLDGSFKRANWDLHAVGGFYACFFLLLITFSGLSFSYKWVNTLVLRLADGKPEITADLQNKSRTGRPEIHLYDKILSQTNTLYPAPGDVLITIPGEQEKAILSTKTIRVNGTLSNSAYFDRYSAELLEAGPFRDLSTGNKIQKLMLPVHTGSIFGVPGQLLALILSLFAASLPVTGFLIWIGRKKKNSCKPTQKTGAVPQAQFS